MKKVIVATLLITLFSIVAFADIARPDKPKQTTSVDSQLDIRVDRDAKEARLVIPRSQVQQLRAELDRLDGGDNAAASVTSGSGTGGVQTIVTGAFLSLALVFGGIWFARSGKRTAVASRVVAGAMVVSIAGAAATLINANVAPPPPEMRSITTKTFAPSLLQRNAAWGKIKLEVSDEYQNPRLIVPYAGVAAAGEE